METKQRVTRKNVNNLNGIPRDAVLKLILSKYNEYYDELYYEEEKLDSKENIKYLDLFDSICKQCSHLISSLVRERDDIFSSDRECIAIVKAIIYFKLFPEK
jgi:hypothetical protein